MVGTSPHVPIRSGGLANLHFGHFGDLKQSEILRLTDLFRLQSYRDVGRSENLRGGGRKVGRGGRGGREVRAGPKSG